MTRPWRLKELTPVETAQRLAHRPAMLVPVGSTEPHGPSLPFGCDTLIVERLADDLSARFGILRAPTIEYGVATGRGPGPGGAALRRKTLHRVMNELVQAWESAGVREFVLLTAEANDAHQEALTAIVVQRARLIAVDVFAMAFGELLDTGEARPHAGELDTSLMLHLAPDLVRQGAGGLPPHASPEKGARLYDYILEQVARHCLAPEETCAEPSA
ncbi:MAG TPA: creatininase family protein [Gemmatimonadales bacterium]|nr:creatininase family protein [Gemmatimonadales bacterium]